MVVHFSTSPQTMFWIIRSNGITDYGSWHTFSGSGSTGASWCSLWEGFGLAGRIITDYRWWTAGDRSKKMALQHINSQIDPLFTSLRLSWWARRHVIGLLTTASRTYRKSRVCWRSSSMYGDDPNLQEQLGAFLVLFLARFARGGWKNVRTCWKWWMV